MHKSKKKSKISAKIPQPMKIKKEKVEEDRTLHPISHYIDDRLEMVKQIFGSLKPKTINNLSPEFLKDKKLHEIEELCLDELLCISKKRLLSICNATKCPTDTESSDDSDVEHKEEHISLEEISSDSEIEGASTSAGKKKTRKVIGKKDAKKSSAEIEKDGQISVLELLELQARARAIRSQLALEPVTKIEVNSDDEPPNSSNVTNGKNHEDRRESSSTSTSTATTKGQRRERNAALKRKSSENEHERANDKAGRERERTRNRNRSERNSSSTKPASTTATAQPSKSHEQQKKASEVTDSGTTTQIKDSASSKGEVQNGPQKKIKINRNYRGSNKEFTSNDIEAVPTSSSSSAKAPPAIEDRSASPDVVPIVTEPVTLMISDSSDDEVSKSMKAKAAATAKDVDTTNAQTATKESPSAAEDEVGAAKRLRTITEVEEGEIIELDVIVEMSADKDLDAKDKNEAASEESAVEKNATGDAEKECVKAKDEEPQKEALSKTSDIEDAAGNKAPETEPAATSTTATNIIDEIQTTSIGDKLSDETAETDDSNVKAPDEPSVDVKAEVNMDVGETTVNLYNDDDNDDIISISGGDLEDEMMEQLVEESKQPTNIIREIKPELKTESARKQEHAVITLDSSEDDRDESWQGRYLKSSKVSKVLAASRLSKRVRDKIKESKHSKRETRERESAAAATVAAEAKRSSSAYKSKHEDGSVEQYKELLEMRQRKS